MSLSLLDNNSIFWFRRDLRLHNNHGLFEALKENRSVQPLFIFDKNILDKLDDPFDRRVDFLHRKLHDIQEELKKHGSSLLVIYGDPIEVFKKSNPKKLYFNRDYEPYARERDEQVIKSLLEKDCEIHHFKDHIIFEKKEVVKDDDDPYSVFTPYSKKWKEHFDKDNFNWSYPSEEHLDKMAKTEPVEIPSLSAMGFKRTETDFPSSEIDRKIIKEYEDKRDIPAIRGTSRLSVHLRFGTISIREALKPAMKLSEAWLNELIWREFYSMILWNHPHVVDKAFKPKYDQIQWRNDEKEFEAWCEGKTGYPIVDAGMRELNQTGFMHNRVRMITASFLVKHLLIDWRWGEAYFGKKLLDYELASNNGGWQWAAGSGCDAAPYFRVFNPELQTKKFDPDLKYIKKWIPEFGDSSYPDPIVDHKFARERALETYKSAVS